MGVGGIQLDCTLPGRKQDSSWQTNIFLRITWFLMQSESHFWQASLHSDVLYVIFRHGKLLEQLLLKKEEEGGETENGKVVSYCSVKPSQLTISSLLTDDNHHLVLKEPAYQFPLPSTSKDRFHFFSCWLTILTVTTAICQANGNVNFRKTDKTENNKLFTHKKERLGWN